MCRDVIGGTTATVNDSEGVSSVLLVTVDSLRADALGPHTPAMNRLAESGTTFERAFALGNWTPFSFPSVLGGSPVFTSGPSVGLGPEPTLAETLRDAGVATAGFNAANGFLSEHWGYDRGFDEFETFLDEKTRVGRFLAVHPTVRGWVQYAASPARRVTDRLRGRERHHAVDTSGLLRLERRATEFLDDVDSPFFLWVHYMDAHTPYVPAPRHLRATTDGEVGSLAALVGHLRAGLGRGADPETVERLRMLYDATVRQVDASVGRILDALDDAGARDDTAVVLAGDHGEEFTEHGHLAHYPKLYDELIRVPLVVDHPDGPSRTVSRSVGLDAVPPTVCNAVDVDHDFEGESVLPAVLAGTAPSVDPVVSVALRGPKVTYQPIPRHLEEGRLLVSARDDRWTYIFDPEREGHELYDREADPGEQDNVWTDHRDEEVVMRLHRTTRRHLDRIEAGQVDGETEESSVPDEVADRLEMLGYR
jgi:arylsulfatase A-like enzyme